MKLVGFSVVTLLIATTPVFAQRTPECPQDRKTYRDFWCDKVRDILKAREERAAGFQEIIRTAISIKNENLGAFTLFAQAKIGEKVDLVELASV